ncbi:MAG: VanZ family protein [Sulfurimonadaceae bacterium]
MKLYNKVTLSKVLFYLTVITIIILAFSPEYGILSPFISFSDLLNHMIAFIVLFLFLNTLYPSLSLKKIIVILLSNAILIEVVQSFLPTHQADWLDVAADSTGMLIGYLFVQLFRQLRRLKNSRYLILFSFKK